MGITSNVYVRSMGLTLPNAYIAVAYHPVTISSRGNGASYAVHATFSVWNSHEDRVGEPGPEDSSMAGVMIPKVPVENRNVHFVYSPAENPSVDDLYAAVYAEIKKYYPDAQDLQRVAANDPVADSHAPA